MGFLTTRRVLWIVFVGLAGFFIGGIGGGERGGALGAVWGGSIGYGFGALFDQKRATKWLVVYWACTLALIGPFFGLIIGAPYDSVAREIAAGGVGALAGMLVGLLVGTMQLRRLRRRFEGLRSSVHV